jgi:hypothetical protein
LIRIGDALIAAIAACANILIAGQIAVCAVLLFSYVPRQQNADDLLPAIMSLQHLTFYYWGQDRFANLLPLATAWIADPTGNADTQIALRIVAGLVAPFCFTAAMFRRFTDAWRATLAADCLMLIGGGPTMLHETFIVATPYGTAFACAGLGILALRGGKLAFGGLGALALIAAQVVDQALCLVALPFFGLLAVLRPSNERMRLLVLLCATAFVALLLPAMLAPHDRTRLGLHPSIGGIGAFAMEIWHGSGWPFWLAIGLPIMACLTVGVLRGTVRPFARLAAIVAVTAGLAFLTIAASEHVMLNDYHMRYYIPVFLLLLAMAGAGVVRLVLLAMPTPAPRDAMLVMLALVALMSARGRLTAAGGPTDEIIGWGRAEMAHAVAQHYAASKLDGIAGEYWDVWPSVFAAEQLHHDAGWTGPDVLPIAMRAQVRRPDFLARLHSQGRLRLACIDQPAEACRETAARIMSIPDMGFREFAPADSIGEGHKLYYAELVLPP